jgi:hypothetical protein
MEGRVAAMGDEEPPGLAVVRRRRPPRRLEQSGEGASSRTWYSLKPRGLHRSACSGCSGTNVAAALQEVGAGSIGGVLVGYGERSRASHHVTRMERRGLVKRQECSDDGRGAWVVLTDAGRAAIERAAPGHVETVRRLVFEVLTRDEIDVLDKVVDKVLARLEEGSIQPTA